MKFKFSFHPKELRGLKGLIAERLVQAYLDKVLIPRLKTEFDFVFMNMDGKFLQLVPLSFIDSALLLGERVNWDEAWNEISAESYITDSISGESVSYQEYARKNGTFKKRWREEHIEKLQVAYGGSGCALIAENEELLKKLAEPLIHSMRKPVEESQTRLEDEFQ